jgi:mannose-6-phosphate isomerase
MPFPLDAELKHYDWGVPGALSNALGRESSGMPEAEIWWGNHPLAECSISTPVGAEDFHVWLEQKNLDFPLLVKLLAADTPLSIQVHPSHEQAQVGFDREHSQGVPLDAPERMYKDRSAKPELLIALSDEFVCLAGFVEPSEVRNRLARWGEWGAPGSLLSLMDRLAGGPREASRVITEEFSGEEGVFQELNDWLLSHDPSRLDEETRREVRLLQKVSSAYPGDPGILFALLMHHVYLQRGEALFVAAGEVHAYVEGFGLEVMLPSDNVIRAGLTRKHTDTEAFMEVADFSATSSPRLERPGGGGLFATYETVGADFVVHRMTWGAEQFTITRPSICFVETGRVTMSDSDETQLGRGDAVFALPGETVSPVSEDALVWLVHSEKN